MQTRPSLMLALGLAVVLVATGCSNACQDLGYRVCQCEAEGQARNNCQTNVKARVRAASPNGSEQDACSSLLASCPDPNGDVNACAWMLNTCPGKVACGLAIPEPGGGSGCTTLDVPADAVEPPASN